MKKAYYHGFNSSLGIFTYVCGRCGQPVDEKDHFCKMCGVNFETGKNHEQSYKSGYEQAKNDIVRLIQGGIES